MDMMRIQQKLKNEEYDTVEQFVADMRNLSENAKCFYKVRICIYGEAWKVNEQSFQF